MMANIRFLLIATFYVAPIWSKYLLVKLDDVKEPKIEGLDAQGKH